MLALYFTLAGAAHIRAHDKPQNMTPAVMFLALYGALAAVGPKGSEA
jgi:hypothetical protein